MTDTAEPTCGDDCTCESKNEVARALEAAPPEELIRTLKVLTHRIHSIISTSTKDARILRSHRDLVEVEMLRRMGGA